MQIEQGSVWECTDEDNEFYGQKCTVLHAGTDPFDEILIEYEDGTLYTGKIFRFGAGFWHKQIDH